MKEYLNSTKSLRLEDGVYYSYRTPVAFFHAAYCILYMTTEKFSVTTSKHMNQIRGHVGHYVPVEWVEQEDFEKTLDAFRHIHTLTHAG